MNDSFRSREISRLETLKLYQALDSGTEKAFDELTRLAAAICSTPIALISLVDERRQWFKSRFGLDVPETGRDVSFCSYAIESDDLMIVADALRDPRFSSNPLVLSDPFIRFYAGAPLTVGNGHRVGTLCVIDSEPRQLTRFQLDALNILRGAVVAQLELKRSVLDLSKMESLLPICAWCRCVKQEDGSWRSLHEYVSSREQVTHGICARCAELQDAKGTYT